MTENRLLGADFLRAAACLVVLFHHLSQRMSWQANLGFIEWFRLFAQIGTFGVAMFFVLSGFLLARPFWTALDRGEPMPSLKTYAMRRAARILPGFWLALVITFVLSFTVFGTVLDGQLVLRGLAGFFLIADWHWLTFFPVDVNGPLWSISFEVTSYILLPLALSLLFVAGHWIGRGWQSRVAWLGAIGLALLGHWLFTRLYRVDTHDLGWDHGLIGGAKFWMPRYNPIGFFAMFAIGGLAAGVQVRLARYRSWLFDGLSLVAIGLTGWVFAVQLSAPDPSGFGWLDIPYAFPWFVLSIALFLAATPSSRLVGLLLDNAAVRYLARVSFGIYIYHYIVLELVRRYWAPDMDHGAMADPVKFVVMSAVIAGLSVAAAHASYYLLEEPVIRWARGREQRGVGAATLSPAAG